MSSIRQAFVLGAGLGTRLRPLTETLPKPLIPTWNRPLITFAFDHLIRELGVERFLVNTHHCPEAYGGAFASGVYKQHSIELRHEPVLLDTAGGIDNVRDWLPEDETFVVYNGDILTDLPLEAAIEAHERAGNIATLILRSDGDELRVGFDQSSGRVVDLRGQLRPDWSERYQFTGIYLLSPAFLKFIRKGKIESVVLSFLSAIRAGERVGGVVIDTGVWTDLGEREAYLDSLTLRNQGFPAYRTENRLRRVADSADIDETAKVDSLSVIGPGVRVGKGAKVSQSVLWSGAVIEEGTVLDRVIVREEKVVSGSHVGVDI
ncbi:MAG: sugar phosphate nucleotidyltransferase [Verrucomicrobiota bacterium]